jgi:hypothetical protein
MAALDGLANRNEKLNVEACRIESNMRVGHQEQSTHLEAMNDLTLLTWT